MKIEINTAQNVNIDYKPAGLLNRIGALCIDYLLMAGLLILATTVINWLELSQRTHHIFLSILMVILVFYHFLFEYFVHGQSPGKMLLRLRVVKATAQKLTFWDCLLRWMLRLADITISLGSVGMISIIATSRMQRLGDLAANTVVIQEAKADAGQLPFDKQTETEEYQVVFPEVTILTDRDIAIIREVVREVETSGEYALLAPLANRIKEITAIQTNLNNLDFAKTILRDYQHLTQ